MVEAYPLDARAKRADMDLYMGNLGAFLRDGFEHVEERGAHVLVRASLV